MIEYIGATISLYHCNVSALVRLSAFLRNYGTPRTELFLYHKILMPDNNNNCLSGEREDDLPSQSIIIASIALAVSIVASFCVN